MGKIGIIIQREFNERVRKRSFIITTVLTPLLMVGLMVGPAILMNLQSSDTKHILVVDQSELIGTQLQSDEQLAFETTTKSADEIRADKNDVFGILIIGQDIMTNPKNVQLYTYESSTLDVENGISRQIRGIIEGEKLKQYDIADLPKIMEDIKTDVSLQAFRIDESGEDKESSSLLSIGLAYVFGFMIYMFVFIYGGMVMQGVIEEKSSKVLEIMVSSVKPYELMMGKILGIASVAITQFLIWIVLIFVLGTVAMQMFAGDMMAAAQAMPTAGAMPAGMEGMDPEALAALKSVTDLGFLAKMFGGFLIYFIGGYLLYAAMFAAIGSAVDNMQDTQQLQLPVTIPMILALLVMMNVMRDPHSSLAVWFSMIPLTSPIIMMTRIPYGVPLWQIITSIVLLYGSFIFMVWVAGKIYRVGIFMYGKKPSLRELIKWSRYKY